MFLWRISRHRDLSGIGGLKAAGRWHYAGRPIVYLAETPAAALLEVCVHTSANDVPPEFALLKVEGPDIDVPSVRIRELPEDWRTRLEITRDLGTAWLEKSESALLRVPSAIVPETSNYLFNPIHGHAAKFRIVEAIGYPFDPRLKKRMSLTYHSGPREQLVSSLSLRAPAGNFRRSISRRQTPKRTATGASFP
jgi:RES domain-containing protein